MQTAQSHKAHLVPFKANGVGTRDMEIRKITISLLHHLTVLILVIFYLLCP